MREQNPQASPGRTGGEKSLQSDPMFSEGRHPRALLITVNRRCEDSTKALVVSLSRLSRFLDLSVIIVDNASGDTSVAAIEREIAELTNVRLLVASDNLGYFCAARFASETYLSRGNSPPDWLIVCNNDVLIDDKEFLEKLFRHDPLKVGVIGPRIQALPGKVDQNPFMRRRPGSLRWANLRFISSNYGAAALWDWLGRRKSEFGSWLAARRPDSLTDGNAKRESIYAAHGSFFIFSRRYFEAGGFLDGNLFLYGEEISVAEICRSLGLPVVYEPSLRVLHKEHQSTGRVLSRFTYECQKKALRYVTSRYLSHSQEPAGSYQPDRP